MPIPAGSLVAAPGVGLQQLRLVDPATSREMVLFPRDGIELVDVDLGFPAIRAVADERTDDDGEDDSTLLHGASSVSLAMTFYEDTRALLDELRAFCLPRARPYLHVVDAEWDTERRVRLRVDQHSAPLTRGRDQLRAVQVQWRAPDGVWEAADSTSVVVPADVPSTAGLSFPLSFPFSWPATTATGSVAVYVGGTADVHWTARLYGPAAGPELTLDSTGETLRFEPTLVIAAGDYLEINSRNRTALLNSLADASRLGELMFAESTWFRLRAGDNLLRYHPYAGTSAVTQAQLEYRNAWL